MTLAGTSTSLTSRINGMKTHSHSSTWVVSPPCSVSYLMLLSCVTSFIIISFPLEQQWYLIMFRTIVITTPILQVQSVLYNARGVS